METVNFKIGEDFGTLITEIAQEKLQYDLDFYKGLDVVKDSLIGIDTKLALAVLLGDAELSVDVEDQSTIFEYVKNDNRIYTFLEQKRRKVNNMLKILLGVFIKLTSGASKRTIEVELADVITYYRDNNKEVIEDIIDSNFYEYKEVIRIIQETLLEFEKITKLIVNINVNTKKYDFKYKPFEDTDFNNYSALKNTISMPIFRSTKEAESLSNYIKVELDEEKNKALIEPVDIKDCYSAGWLAQDGTYYGMNGDIANLLHNKIADRLLEAGVIPKDFKENYISVDNYLERKGWVKQHGNWILYDAYNNNMLGIEDIPISEAQKKAIYDLGQYCHKGVLSLGFAQEKVSAARFQMIDSMMLKTRWFSL